MGGKQHRAPWPVWPALVALAAAAIGCLAGCSDQAATTSSAPPDDLQWLGIAPARSGAPADYDWSASGAAGPLVATNRAQHHVVELDLGQLRLSGTHASAPWSLTMTWTGLGRGDDLAPVPAASSLAQVSRNRLALQRGGGLVEWYVNGPLGLEQGFVLPEPPGGQDGGDAATIELALAGDFTAQLSGDRQSVVLRSSFGPQVLGYAKLNVVDDNGVPLRAWMEASDRTIRLRLDDAGAQYPLIVDPLLDVQVMLTAHDGAALDVFGEAVAASGGEIAVGARNHDAGDGIRSGATYLFAKNGAAWVEQQMLTASDADQDHQFGCSVAKAGGTLVVGARTGDGVVTGSGAAYVFTRSGATWVEQQKLMALDGGEPDWFGASVAVSGDRVAVGAPEQDDAGAEVGVAYVFVRNGTSWTQDQRLTAPAPEPGDLFGSAVAMDGDTIVVGAPENGQIAREGAAYVFVRDGAVWSLQQELTASDGAAGDALGASVALRGDLAVVGAHNADVMNTNSYEGAAYVFARSADAWSERHKLVADVPQGLARFGASVALSAAHIVVGAPVRSSSNSPGAAYGFTRDGAAWTQAVKLEATAGASGDTFGESVAITESFAVIGAPSDDDLGELSGTAHVFFGDMAPGAPCVSSAECASGYCIDGVCCDGECGGGAANDCQACSVAAGAPTNGACASLDGTDCDDGVFCNGPANCVSGTCQGNDSAPCPGPDDDEDCFESCDEQARSCTAYDEDGAACGGGTCDDGTCMLDDGTLCTDASQCKSDYCTGGVCCQVADCGSYRCGPAGLCRDGCSSNLDCVAGYQCYADRTCQPEVSEPVVVDGCGCVAPGRRPAGGHGWWLLALVVGAARRGGRRSGGRAVAPR